MMRKLSKLVRKIDTMQSTNEIAKKTNGGRENGRENKNVGSKI